MQTAQITIANLNPEMFISELTAEELLLIQGGGFGTDLLNAVNEVWRDFKRGFVSGMQ
ncbi:hypothetical protein [Nodularia chucula]|uniref:hypothetical protein n=1 Tax=Nodularia chucula TaxID=3093667 RepID=UPI0039C6C608